MSKNLFKKIMHNEKKEVKIEDEDFRIRGTSFLNEFNEIQKKYEVRLVPVLVKYGLDLEVVNIKENKDENKPQA